MDNELLYLRRELAVGPSAINRDGVRERAEAYCKKLRAANISIDYIAYQLGRSCAFIAALAGEYHLGTDVCLQNPPPMYDSTNKEPQGSKPRRIPKSKLRIGQTLYVGRHQDRKFYLSPELAYAMAKECFNGTTYERIANENDISPTLVREIVREARSRYPDTNGKVADKWPRAQH